MKKLLGLMVLASPLSFATEIHDFKKVETVSSSTNKECTYFSLVGVNEADPVVENEGWFALEISNPAHDVSISILLAAYASGKEVRVSSDGTIKCGFAGVKYIRFAK